MLDRTKYRTIWLIVKRYTRQNLWSPDAQLAYLGSLGGPPILTDTAGRLCDDLIHGINNTGQRFASILAFTSAVPGKSGGMLRRQSTAENKINVFDRVTRRRIVGLKHR